MSAFESFIENNRQLGSTTRLVELVIDQDGYLIVHSVRMREHLLKEHSRLRADQVITIGELREGRGLGKEQRPVFVDTACLCLVEGELERART